MALTWPIFFPMAEENNEKVANVIKGKVVRNPAQALDKFKSSLMEGINGPTPVIEGLRLKDNKMIPVNSNQSVGAGSGLLLIYLKFEKIQF